MDQTLQTALILLFLLQVKHLFADFFMQTARMLTNRETYLHMGRGQHAGIHAGLSLLALLLLGAPLLFSVGLCVLEWLVHYHIDWAKARYSGGRNQTPSDAGYWRAFGTDQLMHQLTYIAMIWAWAVLVV